jgi:hypothetical protein
MKKGFMMCMISAFLFVGLMSFAYGIDLDDSSECECSNGIVNIGDSKYDVIKKCGEPTSREDRGTVWVYDFGSTRFIHYITFAGDTVERIQYGGYGYDNTKQGEIR